MTDRALRLFRLSGRFFKIYLKGRVMEFERERERDYSIWWFTPNVFIAAGVGLSLYLGADTSIRVCCVLLPWGIIQKSAGSAVELSPWCSSMEEEYPMLTTLALHSHLCFCLFLNLCFYLVILSSLGIWFLKHHTCKCLLEPESHTLSISDVSIDENLHTLSLCSVPLLLSSELMSFRIYTQ